MGCHKLNLTFEKPIKSGPHRMAWEEQHVVRQSIDDMMNACVIQSSRSSWAFPMVLALKKHGTMRFCIGSRKLNLITKKDTYLSP